MQPCQSKCLYSLLVKYNNHFKELSLDINIMPESFFCTILLIIP